MISPLFRLTAEQPCSYLDNHRARYMLLDNPLRSGTGIYDDLIELGFRRSGDQIYKPYCSDCRSCIPARIAVNEFQPDRRQKRCKRRNQLTSTTIKPAMFDSRHFDLYQRYQAARHNKSGTAELKPDEYMQFLTSDWCTTWFVEFSLSERLMALAVVDVLNDALSAVYTFFEPELATYSPGMFAVLWQIEQAALLGLEYLYLGFWIANCRKMSYKTQYQPMYGLIDGQWQNLSLPSK